ncbi:ferrichrome-binding protein [Halorhabdus utahensis DSM 12940]|uniref:Ferrichrome-binding protein n=1 Tax=Halorhabdus utahensis (strain DSM 12940 / JCM 11049 / AX-2) TaxID=519442 RepID=C7NUK0_HALUD|nr:ABC transporter substrate-binding protein [Halorhabdus utahensis]ACV12357.1 ferrichrome-binding protein [Halorhabdus utahensis DSM 12940]
MGDDSSSTSGESVAPETPTRREAIKYGGAALVGGLLAGCSSSATDDEGDPDSETATTSVRTETATPSDPTETATTSEDTETTTETESDTYSASIAPMGRVSLEEPPETVFTRLTHHADMAFALGRGDTITAMHAPAYYDRLWNQFIERLPGVTLDWEGLYSSWQPTKEKLYELDSDIHLADPAWITVQDNWDPADIEEIESGVSPWFGNSLSDTHQEPPDAYADGYEYYTLWEQFERVAQLFGEQARYEELAAIHADLLGTIEERLPDESERPSVVMIAAQDLDEIYAYTLDEPGFLTAHTRPFGARDAFDGEVESASVIDYEALLEADPDVILHLGGFEPNTDLAARREEFQSDPVASEITAVQSERVYPQGARYQGPILNLFQLEMTAKQLYPDQFGEWPRYTEGPYPEIPAGEQLFDRERVAAVINGDI